MTDQLFQRDAFLREFGAVVSAAGVAGVVLDRTAFYPGGGGQPCDIGTLSWASGVANVTKVARKDGEIVHELDGLAPAFGTQVTGTVDWENRHALMRTHTALHILCGVIWRDWLRVVTGGNMDALSGRMDFEFVELPEGFAERLEELCSAEIAADRPVEVSFLDRGEAVLDRDLIRTKVNLIPDYVTEIRVVDIVGLDKQADGGTHVSSTGQVGRLEVTKTESKGKGFKRVRFVLHDE